MQSTEKFLRYANSSRKIQLPPYLTSISNYRENYFVYVGRKVGVTALRTNLFTTNKISSLGFCQSFAQIFIQIAVLEVFLCFTCLFLFRFVHIKKNNCFLFIIFKSIFLISLYFRQLLKIALQVIYGILLDRFTLSFDQSQRAIRPQKEIERFQEKTQMLRLSE